MDEARTPREQAQANAWRKRRSITRGGAARLRLLADLDRRRWQGATRARDTLAHDRRERGAGRYSSPASAGDLGRPKRDSARSASRPPNGEP